MNAIVRLIKTLLTLWIILIYHPDLIAQDSVISIIKKANSAVPVRRFPGSAFMEMPASEKPLTQSLNARENFTVLPYALAQRTQASLNAGCADSSFLKIFQADNRAYSFSTSAKTKDGGIVIGGFGRNK